MGYTGYRVTQYIDDNPLSPTYGNTWTERELDTSHCPTGDDEWVLVATSCEATTSGFTGNMIYTYYNSATNQYFSTTASSTECDADTMNEIWVDSGNTYCEQDEDGIYSGWGIQLQVQRNSNLLNYNETREVRIPDATCAEHLEPNWTTIYSHCTIVADHVTGQLSYDGTLEELQIDDNPSSPTFNQTRVIYTPDEENCPAIICDEVERTWEFVDDICGSMMPIEYGLTGLTPDTLYHVYREYESCIVGGVPVKTEPTNRFSATTYQTSVTDCVERWVDTPQTVCIEEAFNGKWLATYTGGTTSSAECDASSAITSGEVTTTDLVAVEIGSCVTGISNTAFTSATTLSSVTIPNSVTSIGNSAFRNCTSLSSVTIPDSVTRIGSYCFQYCSGLTSFTIPSGVTTINWSTFAGCSNLTSVNIPSGVTSIGQYAFANCSGLTSVTIPNSVTIISGNAFSNCTSLISITIPDSVTRIGQNAFNGCSGLTSATIGSGVTIIGQNAFNGCTSLTSVNIPSGVTNINASAFQNCSGLTSVTIPDSVTYIGSYAFSKCSGLTSVTIGSGITSIGAAVFYNCNGLTSITVEALTPPTLGDTAFPSNCSIYVPCSSVNAYKTASEWSNYASRIEGIPPCIPPFEGKWKATYTGGTTSSAECDSSSAITQNEINKTDIRTVTIGNCVTSIEDGAFFRFYDLSSITISNSVTSLGDDTFGECTGLTNVAIPNSVTNIGPGCFHTCRSLTSVGLVGSGASIELPNSITSISDYVFIYCSSLTSVTIPNSVTIIGGAAFDGCTNLERVTIPSGVTSIGVRAFWNCSGLTSVTILATTPPTLIGTEVFGNTNSDFKIYVPSASVETYKSASGWSDYASRIQAIP